MWNNNTIKKHNLDHIIDPSFRNNNRLFVLSSKNGCNDPTKASSINYYIPLVEIKDFNVSIDNKPFFDQPVKNKQEAYEKIVEMSRNHVYTPSKIFWTYCYSLTRQTNMTIPQKINFTGKFDQNDKAKMIFYPWKATKSYSKIFFRFINCTRII